MRKYIRKLVIEAMLSVITEKKKDMGFMSSFLWRYKDLNKFQSALENFIEIKADARLEKATHWAEIDIQDGAKEAVREYLSKEETLDNIVEKLNKKQLRRENE